MRRSSPTQQSAYPKNHPQRRDELLQAGASPHRRTGALVIGARGMMEAHMALGARASVWHTKTSAQAGTLDVDCSCQTPCLCFLLVATVGAVREWRRSPSSQSGFDDAYSFPEHR
jgi:hypothetical protein